LEEPIASVHVPVDANANVQVYPSHRDAPPVPQAYVSQSATPLTPPPVVRDAAIAGAVASSAVAPQFIEAQPAPSQVSQI
jgi:hypothetical protein